jgi:uncharacterized protein YfcZ (UPF0381/DUF406 family)
MNYQIITDENLLDEFISTFLKPCSPDETYYCCLFARSKYAKNEDGTNKFPHIKTDKNQLKRFLATPNTLKIKIKQLEVPFGAYITKDGEPIPQEALALYITPNRRSQKKAMFKLMKRLIDIQECNGQGFNINAEAISSVQKSKSKTDWIDFDIDSKDIDISSIENVLPLGTYKILETRGGYHIMIDRDKVKKSNAPKNWYILLGQMFEIDQSGDNMIPMVGTYQGGFTPKFIL